MADLSTEKRVLLAFALAFVVLAAWSAYMRNKWPQPEEPPPAATAKAPTQPQPPPAAKKEAPPPPVHGEPVQGEPAEAAPAPVPVGAKEGTEERLITVETDKSTIVFSTRGAVVVSWQLKDYLDDNHHPIDLVEGRVTRLGFPFALDLGDSNTEDKLNDALYVADTSASTLTAPAELVFEWSDGHLAARKHIRFTDGYVVEVETEVLRDGKPVAHRLAWRGGFGEHAGEPTATRGVAAQVFLRTPAGLQAQPATLAGKTSGWIWRKASPFPYQGEASYAGIEDRYFAAIYLPQRPQLDARAWTREWTRPGEKKPEHIGAVAVGVAGNQPLRLFVGPKQLDVLGALQPAAFPDGKQPVLADEVVDFGWFWWVAKPLFLAMRWMYDHWVHNYGWVIVLLTAVISIALFPLRWKSMESSIKMQKVAPIVKSIQARYKQYKFNDPRKQQMQQEIMEVYRQHGINPIGGCLPLALQLPFFYGFYKVVAISIEMRHAPWFLWIHDLSQKDPYYVLPLIMTASMYFSMRLTPMTGADPRQARMMQVMMLVFGLMFLQVSAGLVLYWLVSSAVGLVQQVWINRHMHHQQERERAEAKLSKKKRRRLHAEQASEEGEK